MAENKLWTRNFTIITLGSVVSMLGNAVSGFAIGLLVLDKTASTFLYVLTLVAYGLPKIVMPMLAGPYLDRFSRKKVIYSLDFFSSFLFLLIFAVLKTGGFHYALSLVLVVVIGAVDSVYQVAYDSFYPTLISEGNYRRAYSVSSLIFPLAAVMVPVAAWAYDQVGVEPLFMFNAATFFIAAVFETRVDSVETHLSTGRGRFGFRTFLRDYKEGLRYIRSERALLFVTLYFFITEFCAASNDLILPFFKSAPALGVQMYTYLMGLAVAGRLVGGAVHYRFNYPQKLKFAIAIFVYITINALTAAYLYFPPALMMAAGFATGLLGITSYNIRISSTQSYVPDALRGRFNGTFQMLCTLGRIAGELCCGAAAEYMGERTVILILMSVNLLAVFCVMLPGARDVSKLYNRSV